MTQPSLGEPVDRLLGDLEEAGMVNPAVQWVRGEARIASGRFREGMDKIILAALQVPSQLPVVEEALREWENAHPDQEAIPLGMAELAFRRKRYEEVVEVLDRWLHRRPEGSLFRPGRGPFFRCTVERGARPSVGETGAGQLPVISPRSFGGF